MTDTRETTELVRRIRATADDGRFHNALSRQMAIQTMRRAAAEIERLQSALERANTSNWPEPSPDMGVAEVRGAAGERDKLNMAIFKAKERVERICDSLRASQDGDAIVEGNNRLKEAWSDLDIAENALKAFDSLNASRTVAVPTDVLQKVAEALRGYAGHFHPKLTDALAALQPYLKGGA